MAAKIKEMVPESERQGAVSVNGAIGWILKRLGFTTGIGLLGWGGFWFLYNIVLYMVTTPLELVLKTAGLKKTLDVTTLLKLEMGNSLVIANQTIETYFTQAMLGIIIAAFGMVIMYQKKALENTAPVNIPSKKTARKK